MRYDLTRLGAQEFEEMSQALAIAVLGGAVSVFGSGPDGGREATFEGLMRYPQPEPATGPWDGYGVLQAKFRRTAARTGPDTDWFLGEVRKELNSWIHPNTGRVKRGRLPQYLIFTTNVVLSPDPGRGGIDRVEKLIRHYVTGKNFRAGRYGTTTKSAACSTSTTGCDAPTPGSLLRVMCWPRRSARWPR
ncbi:hypothetical protein [Actinokineospora sp. NPDC004072]